MISYLLEAQDHSNNTVLAEVKEKSASFEIGSGRKWEFGYQNEANVSTGFNTRQIHRTWFNLRYTTTLKKLSLLTSVFTVVFLSSPERHIRLQFRVKELGLFSIMIKALLSASSDTMTDTSPDNPLISAEGPAESSSANNQPVNCSFYLEMKSLRKLRLAVEALADPAFNNLGIRRVDVDKKGFEINFQNASNATVHLGLSTFGMIRFQSSNPLIGKLVSLASISQSFPSDFDADGDPVHVFHIHGSNELCFKFGTVLPAGYTATFIETEMDPPIPRFDSLPSFVEIVMPTKDLRQMIEKSLRAKAPHTKSVLLNIKKNNARFETGDSTQWGYECDKNRMLDYFLLRKAEGLLIQGHPVVQSLVEMRLFLEKIRLIDKKCGYLIERLSRTSATDTVKVGEAIKGGEDAKKSEDLLKYKPNPDNLISKLGGETEPTAGAGDRRGVYKPVKILPTTMEGDGMTAKEKRNAEREEKHKVRKARQNESYRDWIDDLDDRPKEVRERAGAESKDLAKFAAQWDKREQREEDLFNRAPMTKLEKRKLKQIQRSNGLLGLADFRDDMEALPFGDDADEPKTPRHGGSRRMDGKHNNRKRKH